MVRFCIQADWDDAPHLTSEQKQSLWASIPPYQRDARSRGIPALGSGAIYPISETEFVIEPIEIPPWWKKVFSIDVGWNRTAVIWGAIDPETDTLYLYAEHYRGQAEPPIHAAAIRARGKWIPGVIDPASRGRSQVDGEQLLATYRALDLVLLTAVNAVEAGIYEVWTRLSTGKLKVFRSLVNWLAEYRIYRRDEKGKVVKENDHLMDATRYLVLSGLNIATQDPRAADRTFGKTRTVLKNDWNPFAESTSPVASSETYDPYKW